MNWVVSGFCLGAAFGFINFFRNVQSCQTLLDGLKMFVYHISLTALFCAVVSVCFGWFLEYQTKRGLNT